MKFLYETIYDRKTSPRSFTHTKVSVPFDAGGSSGVPGTCGDQRHEANAADARSKHLHAHHLPHLQAPKSGGGL